MTIDNFMYSLLCNLHNMGCKSINKDNLYSIGLELKKYIENFDEPILNNVFDNAQRFCEHFNYAFCYYGFGIAKDNMLYFSDELLFDTTLHNNLKLVSDIAAFIYYLNVEFSDQLKR